MCVCVCGGGVLFHKVMNDFVLWIHIQKSHVTGAFFNIWKSGKQERVGIF